MPDDYEDDERPTRDEIAERYGWQPGEREAHERDMTERQRHIDAQAREAAAKGRTNSAPLPIEAREVPTDALGRPLNDPRYRLDPVVTKSYAAQSQVAHAPQVDAEYWDKWRAYILSVVHKKFISRDMFEWLAKTVADWDVEVCKLTKEAREKALEPLRAEVTALRVEVAELRGATSLRANPATTSTADDRRRSSQLVKAKQEIERLRAQMNCDGTARDLDLGRVRGAFDDWRH